MFEYKPKFIFYRDQNQNSQYFHKLITYLSFFLNFFLSIQDDFIFQ